MNELTEFIELGAELIGGRVSQEWVILSESELRKRLLLATIPYDEYLRTERWRSISRRVIERDGCCQACGATQTLQAHHQTYEHRGFEEYHLCDLKTLCWRCHRGFHAFQDDVPVIPQRDEELIFLPVPTWRWELLWVYLGLLWASGKPMNSRDAQLTLESWVRAGISSEGQRRFLIESAELMNARRSTKYLPHPARHLEKWVAAH